MTRAAIGFVFGRPVARPELDRRIAMLREGPLRSALPAPGSAEDRQLARWLTQVILTEALCEVEAARLGLAPMDDAPLDRLAAVELGSINAAAYQGSPWVRAVYRHVAATAVAPSAWRSSPVRASEEARHLVRYALFDDGETAGRAGPDDLEPLGAVTLDSLPRVLAEALRRGPPGTLVGPVQDALGWHVAVAEPADDEPAHGETPALADGRPAHGETPTLGDDRPALDAARRLAFARWVDERRAAAVRLVPGLEHPGDPCQPDNHHKH
ncbi:hypothetical protein OUY22_21530 [Nonomuraea sp. MCN248]|uniref:Peptidyl-prolyl cis-trans isomerase n=1 Tax=Nonomuraea corallina TaxID=2989783 RepID=A0ABT4SGD8_9ACTN|nr:hypothetical protein [Nonomuraea corallina]MDA0636011.1 hypothetical protein [Nonomuraea corallina]